MCEVFIQLEDLNKIADLNSSRMKTVTLLKKKISTVTCLLKICSAINSNKKTAPLFCYKQFN